jgi:mRNA interferase MazF
LVRLQVKRGEVWIIADGKDYAGKPRPVVIIQDDHFDTTNSITTCPFTTDATEIELFRPKIGPDVLNGLRQDSRLMVDKITTSPKSKLGQRIGRLADKDMIRVDLAVLVFLGLAGGRSRYVG